METIINEVKFRYHYIKLKGTEDSPFMSDLTLCLIKEVTVKSYFILLFLT